MALSNHSVWEIRPTTEKGEPMKKSTEKKRQTLREQLRTEMLRRGTAEELLRRERAVYSSFVDSQEQAEKKLSEDLRIERLGRRALHESLRAERLRLVQALYLVDQRLRILRETERKQDQVLKSVNGQVEDELGRIRPDRVNDPSPANHKTGGAEMVFSPWSKDKDKEPF